MYMIRKLCVLLDSIFCFCVEAAASEISAALRSGTTLLLHAICMFFCKMLTTQCSKTVVYGYDTYKLIAVEKKEARH